MKRTVFETIPMRTAIVALVLLGALALVLPRPVNAQAPEPKVAVHVSEVTAALEQVPGGWWPSWHYFTLYESLEEALRSDGTPFIEVSDADIVAGNLRWPDGSPRYPIVISLASEAINDNEIQPLNDYVSAGGFLFVGSSAFTRNPDGSTRGDFALATQMGLHVVDSNTLLNWYDNAHFIKTGASPLVANIPAGTLTWRMPLTSEQIALGVSPAHSIHGNHYVYQVNPAGSATVVATGDQGPLLTVTPYGKGLFLYHGDAEPLIGHGGYDASTYSYLIFRNAIEWAFASDNVPIIKLSPWRYAYDAAFVIRHDLENYQADILAIGDSAAYEHSFGAKGDYYFCTGTLRDEMSAADQTTAIAGLKSAVGNGATIGSHNGGLKNPVNTNLLIGDFDYWHWGPDEALDVTSLPTGSYATGKEYAQASIEKSFQDINGWVTGLDNGRPGCGTSGDCPRIWTAPYFNDTREASYDILGGLGVVSMSDQEIGLFPHWVLSTQTPGKHYSTLALPYSNMFDGVTGDMDEAMEEYTSASMRQAVDFYYGLGGFIQIYGHNPSNASTLEGEYVAYCSDAIAKPRMWSTNAVGVYDWWKARSAVTVSTMYSVSGNTADAQALVSGATDTGTAIELVIPNTTAPGSAGLQVLLNGSPADPSQYRVVGNTIKVLVGNAVSTVDATYAIPNPVPVAVSLSPAAVKAGGTALTLTVNGTGFVSSSVVRWNGSDRTTTYVSSAQLTAALSAADISSGATAQVTVYNPGPGGGASNSLSLAIDGTPPVVTAFGAVTPSASLNVSITAFTASDSSGIAGYLITTSSTPPLAGAAGWTATAPAVWTAGGDGSYTLYPWAKDAVGNVSAVYGSPKTVVVDRTAPVVSSFTAVTPSKSLIVSISSFTASDANGVAGYLITTSSVQPLAGDTGWSGSAPTAYTVASEGTSTLYPWAKDGAGNVSAIFATPRTVVVDLTAPTVTLSTTASDPTRTSPIPVTAQFSETVTGFLSSEVIVTNGTVTAFSGSGTNYSFGVVPSANGAVTVSVGANAAQDAAGNGNTASTALSRTFDNTPPTVTISSSATPTTNQSPIPVTVQFSETVTGFTSSDVLVTNGTVTGFSGSGMTYSFNVTPQANGAVTVAIGADVATDAAGNGNAAATPLTRTYDTVAPTVTLSSSAPDPTNAVIPVTALFSEPVTGFAQGDITVTNGVAGAVTGSGASYSFSVTPSGNGMVTVSVVADAAQDAAGNGNTASAALSRTFDSLQPTVVITSPSPEPTNTAPIPVTVQFSKEVTGFTSSDVLVTNGTVTGFSGSGMTYSFNVTPQANGAVTVSIGANAATDAAGNGNIAATPLTRTYDTSAPTVTLSTTASDPTRTSPIPVTAQFSETVTGFLSSEVIVTNGTVTAFAGSGTNYSFGVVPSANGTVTVSIGANTAQDAAGNGNTASAALSRTFDNTPPTVTISSSATPTTNQSPIPVTVQFSEPVTGFTSGDVAVTNGSLSGFTGSGTTYSFSVVPQAEGAVTVSIGADAAQDAAGNGNAAATPLVRTYDHTAPSVVIGAPSSAVGNSGLPVTYLVTYGGADAVSLSAADVTLNRTGTANGTVSVTGTGTGARTVTISSITGSGSIGLSIAANTASDAAGNSAAAAGPSTVFSVDNSSGDLNGDGKVDAADALEALRISSGLDAPTAEDMAHADVAPVVNGVPQPDGKIDIGDVVVILRRAVGLMTW